MVNIQSKTDCCGCKSCGDACSQHAISFCTDNEGFWYPKVDEIKCTNCHVCERVCPIIRINELKKNDLSIPVCYAAEHKNLEVVFDSTSGGLFSAMAETIYKNGGYVGGAVFNDDFSVAHFISNDKKDLPRLRSSKYLQSDLTGFYRQVKVLLQEGNTVLVCGTPCQMAALRAFLNKGYDNLIILDFVCRGVNSPKVWKKYLESLEERYNSKVVYSKAKSKEFGWRKLTQKVVLENGKSIYETYEKSDFTKGYLNTNVFCRPSCYHCKFKGYPRIADITLGDFWGIKRKDPTFDKDLGTSLVIINSKKGETFFDRIKQRIKYIAIDFESAKNGNNCLNKSIAPPKVNRSDFFRDLDTYSFDVVAEKYIRPFDNTFKKKIRNLLHFGYRFIKTTQLRPFPIFRFFKYNSLKDIYKGDVIITAPYTIIKKEKGAKIKKKGVTRLGCKRFKSSKQETRLLLEKGSTLSLNGNIIIGYGADIEILKGGILKIGDGVTMNIGTTIVCKDRVEIGNNTMIGRHVTIRDNNGAHYLNRSGYKNSRPVIIGDKVWLCEQSTVMPGVQIDDSAIVSALSFVIGPVKKNTVVSGNPAHVVDEDILWKC